MHDCPSRPISNINSRVSPHSKKQTAAQSNTPAATYGFLLIVVGYFVISIYTLWALLPSDYLELLGDFWPQRCWALIVPLIFCFSLIVLSLSYFGSSFISTPSHTSPSLITGAHCWRSDDVLVYSGIDCRKGGTWLGMSNAGRIAAVTNIHTRCPNLDSLSRGSLVSSYLTSSYRPTHSLIDEIRGNAADYNPFNLLLFDINETRSPIVLSKNRNGEKFDFGECDLPVDRANCISNCAVSSDYNKTIRGRRVFQTVLEGIVSDDENRAAASLFRMLYSHEKCWPDPLIDQSLLVDEADVEKLEKISSLFVDLPDYKTRTSSVIIVDWLNRAHFYEKTWQTNANAYQTFLFSPPSSTPSTPNSD